MMRLK